MCVGACVGVVKKDEKELSIQTAVTPVAVKVDEFFHGCGIFLQI